MYSSWSHFSSNACFLPTNFHRFPLFNETEARSISCWKLSGNALVKYSRSVSRNSESRSFTNGAQLNSFAEKNELAPARTKSSFRDSAAIVFLKLCSYWINEKLKSFSLLFGLLMSLNLNRKKNRNICPKIKFRFKKMRSSSYRVTGSMYYFSRVSGIRLKA